MNRFAKSNSIIFVLLTWTFAWALFADGANLDDLIPGKVVLHDDEDMVSQQSMESAASALVCANVNPHAIRHIPPNGGAQKQDPIPAGRVIVDQDSPSLAADHLIGKVFSEESVTPEESAVVAHLALAEELHLRLCTLLI